jgi:hypothetical protein
VDEDVAQWGRAELSWLRGVLMLACGVASPGTFERVLALLEPKGFERALRSRAGPVISPV